MFLSDADLIELTGYEKPAAQKRWLDKLGWVFVESAFGKPKVLRAYAEKKLGLASETGSAQTEPDFSRWEGSSHGR